MFWSMKGEQTQNIPDPTRSFESLKCLSFLNLILFFCLPKEWHILKRTAPWPRFCNGDDKCHRATGQPATFTEDMNIREK